MSPGGEGPYLDKGSPEAGTRIQEEEDCSYKPQNGVINVACMHNNLYGASNSVLFNIWVVIHILPLYA